MANDCLVTRLKSVVDNDALIELATLNVVVDGTASGSNERWLLVSNSKPFKVYSLGGGFTVNDVHHSGREDTVELGANAIQWILLDSGTYSFRITEKYTLEYLSCNGIVLNIFGWNVDDIKNYTSITTLGLSSELCTGDVSSIQSIGSFFINNTSISGDISCFAGKSINSPLAPQMLLNASPLTGDIVNLSGINNAITILSVQNTRIYGSVESLVNALDRSTGTITVYATYSDVTYNGQTFNEQGISTVTYNFETGVYTTA